MKVMVETSAHHVHVTKETLEALFGKGATLTNKKNLSQPGQFACVEKVTVVGPKSEMKMSILGPERSADQVEISLTDARKLGIAAPVRESGDIEETALSQLTMRHSPELAKSLFKDNIVRLGRATGRSTTSPNVVALLYFRRLNRNELFVFKTKLFGSFRIKVNVSFSGNYTAFDFNFALGTDKLATGCACNIA